MAVIHLIGRILLGGFFLFSGLNHLIMGRAQLSGYAKASGVPAPKLAVVGSGLLLLLGGVSVVLGWYPRWGVALLTVFLIPTSFMIHSFWQREGQERQNQMIHFMKNLALLGALWALLGIPLPWPYGLGS